MASILGKTLVKNGHNSRKKNGSKSGSE